MDAFLFETRKWVSDLKTNNQRLENTPADCEQLALDFAHKLEKYFQDEVSRELANYGKESEWEHVLAYGGQYLYIWLGINFPGMKEFRREVFARARKELIKDLN